MADSQYEGHLRFDRTRKSEFKWERKLEGVLRHQGKIIERLLVESAELKARVTKLELLIDELCEDD